MKINELEKILDDDGIVFLTYGGMLSQKLLITMTESLEQESEINKLSMGVTTNLLTIFIELTQNMMNYSKAISLHENIFDPKGLIIVGHEQNKSQFYVFSKNIVSSKDKEKIAHNIEQVVHLDKSALRVLYREQRRNGYEKHSNGAGLGFAEIARRCNKINYNFSKIDDSDNYDFTFKAVLETQGK